MAKQIPARAYGSLKIAWNALLNAERRARALRPLLCDEGQEILYELNVELREAKRKIAEVNNKIEDENDGTETQGQATTEVPSA